MHNVSRTPNRAYQSALYAAQDDQSTKCLMQETSTEKETLEHILCECPVLENIRMQTLDFVRMNPDQIKDARLSSIVAFSKGAGLLNSPHKFK